MDSLEKISYRPDKPPKGYTFVAKGDVYITRHCRTLSGKTNKTLFGVYDKRAKKKLGVHCHTDIFKSVQADAAATAERREKAVAAKDRLDYRKNRTLLYKDFPNIPEVSAKDILDHSFLKGSRRVGRTKIVSDKSRITLAVNAHIRHKLTAYEFILASASTNENREITKRAARAQVHHRVELIANSWRTKSIASQNNRLVKPDTKTDLAADNPARTVVRNRPRRRAQAEPRPRKRSMNRG